MDKLADRTTYNAKYLEYEDFAEKILSYTSVPYQIEIQPGREKGKALCWMSCPYCYGGSAQNSGDRLSADRYKEIIKEVSSGPNGRIEKLILAGYATDPLNYEHFDDLYECSLNHNFITGIHTKLLKISNKFLEMVSWNHIKEKSYISVSIDAGFKESYNVTHGITTSVDILGKIYKNIKKIQTVKNKVIDINTTYLLTVHNCSLEEISKSIEDLQALEVDTLRFSFPQVPRKYDYKQKSNIFIEDRAGLINQIKNLIKKTQNNRTFLSIVDPDSKYEINELRAIPCYARFAHPAIGLDGYLYHCSESSSPDFHDQSLGNLKDKNFWELYYSYNKEVVEKSFKLMEKNKCMCDRKLFIVNREFQKTGKLDEHNFKKV
jgi:MoaA/NifB/PqqE/SkfB family radical SAM enzyme